MLYPRVNFWHIAICSETFPVFKENCFGLQSKTILDVILKDGICRKNECRQVSTTRYFVSILEKIVPTLSLSIKWSLFAWVVVEHSDKRVIREKVKGFRLKCRKILLRDCRVVLVCWVSGDVVTS